MGSDSLTGDTDVKYLEIVGGQQCICLFPSSVEKIQITCLTTDNNYVFRKITSRKSIYNII